MRSVDAIDETGLKLHQRLIAGDVTASAEIAELFLPRVTDRLSRVIPLQDDVHLVDTAVEDAILNYIARPSQYKPERLSLESYLVMSAKGDLINLLDKQKRNVFIRLTEFVELGDSGAEQSVELTDPQSVEEIVTNRLSSTWESLRCLLPNPVDQQMVLLMMDSVRETIVYAEILGIADLPNKEQERIVKQNKDRIKKKIIRHINSAEMKNE